MQFNNYKGGNILVHHFSDNTNEGALDYQKLVNKKLIDSFTNYPVTVVSDTYHSIGNKSTCSINKMSERLVENSVVVFIGISANRSNDLDFIAKTLSLIYDRNITFMWICNWVNNELPLTLIKDSYKSCYVRISPLFGHGSTDIDREFSSIYGENNYDRDIQDLMGLAIM